MKRVIFVSLILIGMIYGSSVKSLEAKCQAGNMKYCTKLGLLYAEGIDANKDAKRAFKLLNNACNNGELNACVVLGYTYKPVMSKILLSANI